jgi:hypothetical protein
MANAGQNDRRKGNRRQGSRRETDLKTIEIEGKEDKEQEVTVVTGAEKKAASVWSGHEEFTREWSETFITKKKKKHPRKGE